MTGSARTLRSRPLRSRPLHLRLAAVVAALAAVLAGPSLRAGADTAAVTGAGTGVGTTVEARAAHPSADATTWAASDDTTGGTLTEMTVRNIVRTSVGGTGLRIRLSNTFGDQPITFGSAFVGVADTGPALVPGSNRRLLFDGRPSVSVPAGGVVLSDPLRGSVPAARKLAVSLYLRGSSGRLTAHNRTMQETYKSQPGDHAADESGEPFTTQSAVWFWLDAVVLSAPRAVDTVAALGDSITSGVGSTVNADLRWTDVLADRLETLAPAHRHGVANEGISANRVLEDGVGLSARKRLVTDVMTKPGVSTVILLAGINDIGAGASAADLLDAYRQMADDAHARGRCLLGGTLPPFEGASYYSDAKEQVRRSVNTFVRDSGVFDGVVDFDRATRDPAQPSRLTAAYDSGDHLHPSDAGYQAMGASVDLSLLRCARQPLPASGGSAVRTHP